jgi:hypothetical protein
MARLAIPINARLAARNLHLVIRSLRRLRSEQEPG